MENVTVFIQIILDCLTVYLIYKIALVLFEREESDIGNFTRFGPEELVLLNREDAKNTKEEKRRKKEEVDK